MFAPLISKIVLKNSLSHKHSNDLFYFNIAPSILKLESILCATPPLNFPNFICHLRQNLFNTCFKAKAIEATELKLEFSGIRVVSYNFSRRGGVAHKMDSNFSMLGAMLK